MNCSMYIEIIIKFLKKKMDFNIKNLFVTTNLKSNLIKQIQMVMIRSGSLFSALIRFYARNFSLALPVFILFFLVCLNIFDPQIKKLIEYFKPAMGRELISQKLIISPEKYIKNTRNNIVRLENRFNRNTNDNSCLIVNSTENRFSLFQHGNKIREGMCSTGSYILLVAGDQKKWKFETPKGRFFIQGKTEFPVWKKPDWAFIEDGLSVPSESSPQRYEYGVLGDYALSIGHGYLIHGTLYKRLLGMPVTHGCIRLDDSDLEVVYHSLEVGSKVYIFSH